MINNSKNSLDSWINAINWNKKIIDILKEDLEYFKSLWYGFTPEFDTYLINQKVVIEKLESSSDTTLIEEFFYNRDSIYDYFNLEYKDYSILQNELISQYSIKEESSQIQEKVSNLLEDSWLERIDTNKETQAKSEAKDYIPNLENIEIPPYALEWALALTWAWLAAYGVNKLLKNNNKKKLEEREKLLNQILREKFSILNWILSVYNRDDSDSPSGIKVKLELILDMKKDLEEKWLDKYLEKVEEDTIKRFINNLETRYKNKIWSWVKKK